ncbi:hypothetical protein RhiirA4_466422 [Rhizophagus irregularis]|uniref:Uncharacterized protein n=1 Tax=Rhizophagus irregularis TaxID=588596 RepID=A0A2I1GTZ1_9GLOM|nr:hypothetical protein RhiirA4_466422 [Rhizophagus irregularis]
MAELLQKTTNTCNFESKMHENTPSPILLSSQTHKLSEGGDQKDQEDEEVDEYEPDSEEDKVKQRRKLVLDFLITQSEELKEQIQLLTDQAYEEYGKRTAINVVDKVLYPKTFEKDKDNIIGDTRILLELIR